MEVKWITWSYRTCPWITEKEKKTNFMRFNTLQSPIVNSNTNCIIPWEYFHVGLVLNCTISPLVSPLLSSSALVVARFSLKLNEHNFQLPIESDRSTSVGTYSSGKSQRGDKK